MLTSVEIHNIKFGRAMGGYKLDEVDVFLDKVETDYAQYENLIKEFQAKIEGLNKEIEELKNTQDSIQNVLLKSQILADKIVSEAKEKSEEIIRNAESNISIITAKEKELAQSFELKAQERKEMCEKELEQIISDAKRKADSITAAADDSVARQQVLFEKIKLEIASFKSQITAKYKEHLEILNSIPDTVPQDPKTIAEIVSATIEKEPNPQDFIKKEEVEEIVSDNSVNGFVIENLDDKDDDLEEE